jgi:hypothetical protein
MRSVMRALVPVVALAAGAVAVAVHGGCSSSTPPGPAAVRGKVTFQGRPLSGGLVVFAPDRDRGTTGKPIRGEIGPDGTFRLNHDGTSHIPPGWYRVAIAAAPGDPEPGRPAFPPQLRRPDTSGLLREVTAGKEHSFEFAVEVPNG